MSESKGAVVFVGDPNTTCDEALGYSVFDADGNEIEGGTSALQPGYEVREIPEAELKRWLLNQNFRAASPAAETAANSLASDVAGRINGVLIDKAAAEAEVARRAEVAEEIPLEERKKDELLSLAEERGVEVESKATKAEIIEKVRAAEAGRDDPANTTESVSAPPSEGTITDGGQSNDAAGEEAGNE